MDPSLIFVDRLPRRPYCADDVSRGLLIRPAHSALEYRHIQPNAPLEVSWLVFDLDYPGAAFGWEKPNLPPPTIAVTNPQNGHAHLFYGLVTPVCLSDAARAAPIRYAAALQAAFLAKLCADTGYVGLIAKNPLNGSWRTIWINHLYDLGELADYVTLPKRQPERQSTGLGRNCTLFDELRAWAYRWAREYKRNGASAEIWREAVRGQAERMNVFETPLLCSEVKATARSVAIWTWRHFDDRSFSSLQSARGRLGGRPRTTTKDGEPWAALGISRATYYRHGKSGLLVPE